MRKITAIVALLLSSAMIFAAGNKEPGKEKKGSVESSSQFGS